MPCFFFQCNGKAGNRTVLCLTTAWPIGNNWDVRCGVSTRAIGRREGPIRGTMRQQLLKPCIVARAFKGSGRSVRMLVMKLRTSSDGPFLSDAEWQAIGCHWSWQGGISIFLRRAFEGVKESRIAHRLGISVHTVHTHVCRLYKKLGVRSRAELVRLIFREHIAHTCRRCCDRCSLKRPLQIERRPNRLRAVIRTRSCIADFSTSRSDLRQTESPCILPHALATTTQRGPDRAALASAGRRPVLFACGVRWDTSGMHTRPTRSHVNSIAYCSR